MDESPLITCIIPTYRRPQMLERAIHSALNQTVKRLRVFVTDNASGDETPEVVRHIQAQDSRVIYHCQPENIGMHANFYYGMSRIDTPFYSLLSDDDVLFPQFYERAYSAFQKFPQAMLVATKVPCVTSEGRFISEPLALWDRMGLFEPPAGAQRVAAIAHPTITGILFRQEFLQTPYAYPDPNIYGGDYEMIFNASLHYPIVTVDCEGAIFFHHLGPREKAVDPFAVIDNCFEWIRRVNQDDRFPPEVKAANRNKLLKYLSGYLNGLIIRLAIRGDRYGAEKALAILANDIGQEDRAAKLRLLNQFCYSLPILRPLLRTVHGSFTALRNRLKLSRFVLGEPRYRVYLNNVHPAQAYFSVERM